MVSSTRMKECDECGLSHTVDIENCLGCGAFFAKKWDCQWCHKWNSLKNGECIVCGVSALAEHPEDSPHPPGPVYIPASTPPYISTSQIVAEPKTVEGLERERLIQELKEAVLDNRKAVAQYAQQSNEEIEREQFLHRYQNNHPHAGRQRYIGESVDDYLNATLKLCQHCEQAINLQATLCAHCNTPQQTKTHKPSKILPLAIGAFIGFKLFSSKEKDK